MNLDPKNAVDENELGNAYFWGNEETKQDLKQAVVWYQKAADKGLPIAIFNLAYCALFKRRMSSSVLPENIEPQITSIQPDELAFCVDFE